MKICLLMFYDEAIKEYGYLNYKINEKYCKKYNIDIILSSTRKYIERNPAWERIPLILEHIDKYDYVIWIDADAFFYDDSENIINIINENLSKDFIFSKDIENKGINSGFIIIKNTQYSKDFLKIWGYDPIVFKNNPHPYWRDQGVLLGMYYDNLMNITNNSICIDYCVIQHFFDYELCQLQKKPYIYHLAGQNYEIRVKVSKQYYNQIFLNNP